ncbi:MAG: hypothetical protein V3G42_13090 [Oscillospiraceae bacterium]
MSREVEVHNIQMTATVPEDIQISLGAIGASNAEAGSKESDGNLANRSLWSIRFTGFYFRDKHFNIRGDCMTIEQKEQIMSMRKNGSTYSEISVCLKVPESTIKSFFRRIKDENKPDLPTAEKTDICKQCGKTVVQISGRKKILFCCGECRQKWWNAHPEAVNRKAIYTFICIYCGKEFEAYGNNHRKYCSHECYIKDRFRH